jgi:hypothetical protein
MGTGDALTDADHGEADDTLVRILDYRLALELAAACASSKPPLFH